MLKRKKFGIIAIILFIILVVIVFFRNIYVPNAFLKKAVAKSDLGDNCYIVCKRARVTGFEWIVVKDENGDETHELCNISGCNPFSELDLKHEFVMAKNEYIFYIKNVEEVYSPETEQTSKLYYATDWDILYPVKHGSFVDFISSKWYIYLSDAK